MAKQSKKEGFSFSEIGELVRKTQKDVDIIIRDKSHKRLEFSDFIDTGSYILNASLSGSIFGGIYPRGITQFGGDPGTGKSYMCLSIASNALKMGYYVLYIDTEAAIEIDMLDTYGIDSESDAFELVSINKIEHLIVMMTQFLDGLKIKRKDGVEIPKIIIFLDSLAMMASIKEIQDALDANNKQDMTKAKALGALFRIITVDLAMFEIPLIITNHVYVEIGAANPKYAKKVLKGGTASRYSASNVMMLSVSKDDDNVDSKDPFSTGQSGVIIRAKSEKNRRVKNNVVKIPLDYNKGINRYAMLEAFCTPENFEELGIAQGKMDKDKNGNMTFKPGGHRWYIRHLDKSVFLKNLHSPEVFTQEILEKIDKIVLSKFSYGTKYMVEEDIEMDELNDNIMSYYNEDLDEMIIIDDDLNELDETDN